MSRLLLEKRMRMLLLCLIVFFLITLPRLGRTQEMTLWPFAQPEVQSVVREDGSETGAVIPPGVTQLMFASAGESDPLIETHLKSTLTLAKALNQNSCVDDWANSGGNSGRFGQSDEIGPADVDAVQLWPPIRSSLIAYQPVIENNRVFTVRIKEFGNSENLDDSPIVALDLTSGEELWFVHLPKNPGDWTTWVGGVRNGLLFASRSGNGGSVAAKLYALNVATGAIVWESQDTVTAGPYDGMVFAPDGDPIVGSFTNLTRIDAETGETVWDSPRRCSVSSSCGAAVNGNAVYVADSVPVGGGQTGGHVIVRFDLETGVRQYESPAMGTGILTVQNTPMAGPDGTVYLSRTMNNASYDFFYAFSDTGSEFIEKWNVPAAWTTHSEFGIGLDGSVYTVAPGYEVVRRDPATGAVTATTGPLTGLSSARIAIDGEGNVYLANKAFATGRLYAFTADLMPIWDSAVVNINVGGPALGRYGTLVVCGIGTDARAYRLPDATLVCTEIMSDGFESGDFSGWSDYGVEP